MKNSKTKRVFSIMLCLCFLILAGCSGGETSDTQKEVKGKTTTEASERTGSLFENLTSDFKTETSTSTTTSATASTSTSTQTSGSTQTPSTEPTQTEPSSKPSSDTESDGEKLIALTFDDGPHTSVTDEILDVLEQYGAKATFFVVGNRAGYDKDALKRAVDIGCEVGSHTYSHTNLTKLTVEQMHEEMDKSAEAISSATGKPVKLMRPPEGAHNETVRNNINYPLIMWSVDSKDWKHRDVQKNYDEITNYVFDGAIILMHDLYPATADTVKKLIPDLMAKGYKFVTVSELMSSRGITMENGKAYSSAKP